MKIFNFKKVRKETRDYYGEMKEIEIEELNIPKIITFSFVVMFLLTTILSSFQTINSGEVGLKVKFGKITNSSLSEGFNFKIPYIEKIVKVNIKVQKTELTTSSASKDLQDISTTIAVNYRVESDKASELYRTVGNSYEETILQPAIQESIKSVISQFTAEETITKRNEVSSECMVALQEKVAKYGIIIDNFNITNLEFSDEYSKAIEDKQVAEQKLAKAKLEADAKIVEAEATQKANELMKQTLTDEIIAKQFIERWDGKLSDTLVTSDDIMSIFGFGGNK